MRAGCYLAPSRAADCVAAAAAIRRRVRVLRLPPPDEPTLLADDADNAASAAVAVEAAEGRGHERPLPALPPPPELAAAEEDDTEATRGDMLVDAATDTPTLEAKESDTETGADDSAPTLTEAAAPEGAW